MDEKEIRKKLYPLYIEMEENLEKLQTSMSSIKGFLMENPDQAELINKSMSENLTCIEYQVHKTKSDISIAMNILEDLKQQVKNDVILDKLEDLGILEY